MLCTLTMNPALDYVVTVPDFAVGKTNRTTGETLLPGGKGINAAIVAARLGCAAAALGFEAGFTGRELTARLRELGVAAELTHLDTGCTRINVKLKNLDATEINARGPEIPAERLRELTARLEALTPSDMLLLAGSVPKGVPESLYRDILRRMAEKRVPTAVDAAGELLRQTLPLEPFLIKPNRQELGELFGTAIRSRDEAIPYAVRLREEGARNVLVSLGGEGAVLADGEGAVWSAAAPDGRLINAVGAGDSMVAGFLAGWTESGSYESAFRTAVAAGSAAAFSEWLPEAESIRALAERVQITEIE